VSAYREAAELDPIADLIARRNALIEQQRLLERDELAAGVAPLYGLSKGFLGYTPIGKPDAIYIGGAK
jgi:hypothetical protein